MLDEHTGIFTEKGGTILFTLTKSGIVVVDSQFPDSAARCIEELRKKSEKPFALLINTHHHGDHSSGNISFKGIVKHVLAHENSLANQKAVAAKNKTEDKQLYPDQTFGNVWEERIGKETVSLRYFGPGHTNGDAYVHFKKSGAVHCGDLVFNRRHPVIDRSAGANIKSWISNLQQATDFFPPRTKYVCGHAAEVNNVIIGKEDVLLFKDYLSNLITFAQEKIKSGTGKEEFLKSAEIPGSPQWKGDAKRALDAAWEETVATATAP